VKKRLFPEDAMFVNCLFTFKNKELGLSDSVILVWKDKEGKKGYTYIEDPEYTYYVTKDIPKQFSINKSGFEYRYISMDDVIPVKTKFSKRYSSMSKHTSRATVKNFYNECIDSGNYKMLQQMHLFNEFHGSDVNITDYYIDLFCQENDQEKCEHTLSIGSFDIEVDGADYPGFPNEREAPCPVNLITYYNTDTNVLTVFMLKYNTKTFKELTEKEIKNKVKEVKEKFKPYFGNFKIKAKILSSELGVIASFFNLVNIDRPDYNLAWNARFDIVTLYERLKKILPGTDYTPEDIMCPEEFPVKRVIINLDDSEGSKKDFTARTDVFNIYGYTVWLDMLPLYGNITRPMGKKESYTLNAIGMEETNLGKEDLSSEDTDIKTAHLDNYPLFFKYGCTDTMLLALIIKNTGYVDLLHTIVTLTHTRANKALTKTVCLRNYVSIFYRELGYVISNNRCSLHHFDKNSISGAYVAPTELIDMIGSINNIPSNKCFNLVIDEDLSAMYPSIIRVFNISSSTAEFRIIMRKHTGEYEIVKDISGKPIKQEIVIDMTKEFMEKYLSEDDVRFCKEFHNLPDYDEMYNIFAKKAS